MDTAPLVRIRQFQENYLTLPNYCRSWTQLIFHFDCFCESMVEIICLSLSFSYLKKLSDYIRQTTPYLIWETCSLRTPSFYYSLLIQRHRYIYNIYIYTYTYTIIHYNIIIVCYTYHKFLPPNYIIFKIN